MTTVQEAVTAEQRAKDAEAKDRREAIARALAQSTAPPVDVNPQIIAALRPQADLNGAINFNVNFLIDQIELSVLTFLDQAATDAAERAAAIVRLIGGTGGGTGGVGIGGIGVTDIYTGIAAETLTVDAPFVYVDEQGMIARASALPGGNAATGYILEPVGIGEEAIMLFSGRVKGQSDLVVGRRYYLSDTVKGGLTDKVVVRSGGLFQYLGRAVSTTTLSFEPDDFILRA